MIEKSISELNFVHSRNPVPTVEVDIDSIPENLSGYYKIIEQVLQSIVNKSPKTLSTIYVYQGQSVNFGTPTFSAFFGIAGQKKLLKLLLEAFQKIPGIKVRYSDYINPSAGICEFHVQDGYVWRPADAITWYAINSNTEEIENKTLLEEETIAHNPSPSRYRAARGDASIGTIKKEIEKIFGLPDGSVALCDPNGHRLRADAKIDTLRRRWD